MMGLTLHNGIRWILNFRNGSIFEAALTIPSVDECFHLVVRSSVDVFCFGVRRTEIWRTAKARAVFVYLVEDILP